MNEVLPPFFFAFGGLSIGIALGWLTAARNKADEAMDHPTVLGRLGALEDEKLALAKELVSTTAQLEDARRGLGALAPLQEEILRLQDQVAHLERQLVDQQTPAGVALAAAERERDAAQRALLKQVAREATRAATDPPVEPRIPRTPARPVDTAEPPSVPPTDPLDPLDAPVPPTLQD